MKTYTPGFFTDDGWGLPLVVCALVGGMLYVRATKKKPLPDDEKGAALLVSTAGRAGLLAPDRVIARQGNKTQQQRDAAELVEAMRLAGYTLNPQQLAAAGMLMTTGGLI